MEMPLKAVTLLAQWRQSRAIIIVFATVLLVALGDLRNGVTPLGYWIAWFAIAALGGDIAARCLACFISNRVLFLIFVGFYLMVFSMVLSAIVNEDITTAYQAVKVALIFAIFVVVVGCMAELRRDDFVNICLVVVLIVTVVFVVGKYFFPNYYILLGDGRQGSIVAYPGVMWKTAVFFSFFLIINAAPHKYMRYTAFGCAFFLLLSDGSRTGMIWYAIVLFAYSGHRVISMGNKLYAGLVGVGVSCLTALGVVLLLASDFLENIALRFLAGDPVREKMLGDGLHHLGDCLVLGCGFASTFSLVGGEPMVVHNAYLAVFGDMGIVGFVALIILLVAPLCFCLRRGSAWSDMKILAVLAYTGFPFLFVFHPFSTELSEWGLWVVLSAVLARCGGVEVPRSKSGTHVS